MRATGPNGPFELVGMDRTRVRDALGCENYIFYDPIRFQTLPRRGAPAGPRAGRNPRPPRAAAARGGERWRSIDYGPGDGGRLAAGDEPAGRGSGQRHADDREGEVEDGHVTQVTEVVVGQSQEHDVGAGDAEDRAEECECPRSRGRQRAADARGGSGRGQSAEVTGALAADEADR